MYVRWQISIPQDGSGYCSSCALPNKIGNRNTRGTKQNTRSTRKGRQHIVLVLVVFCFVLLVFRSRFVGRRKRLRASNVRSNKQNELIRSLRKQLEATERELANQKWV